MRFKQFYLKEAIPLSVYREQIKKKLSKEYHNRYNVWFKGEYRIYIPLDKKEEPDMKPLPEIESFLKQKGYKIDSYKQGIVSKPNDKNIYKIGRILNKENQTDLLKKYNEHKSNIIKKEDDLLVVISRHPYDIAGMSTDRHWTSCKELNDINAHYIPSEIDEGLLVAYIIKNTDKNISNPIGRVLIVPYIDLDNKDNKLLAVADQIYGSDVSGFRETVQKWLDSKQGDKKGLFVLPKTVYDNGYIEHIFSKMSDKEKRDLISKPNVLQKMIKHNPSIIDTIPKDVIEKTFESNKIFRQTILNIAKKKPNILNNISTRPLYELMVRNKEFRDNALKAMESNRYILDKLPHAALGVLFDSDKEFRDIFLKKAEQDVIKQVPREDNVLSFIPYEVLVYVFETNKEFREDVLKVAERHELIFNPFRFNTISNLFKTDKEFRDSLLNIAITSNNSVLNFVSSSYLGELFASDTEVRDKILKMAEQDYLALDRIPEEILRNLFNSDEEFKKRILEMAKKDDNIFAVLPYDISSKYGT